ncbi:MAG: hypothetical protein ACTSSB_00500 [Candidatus Heimdallarchaeota archaeon]
MKRTSRTNFLLLSFLITIMIFNLVNVSQANVADTTNDEQMVSLEMEQVIPEITKTSTSDFVSTISADADKNWTFMIYIAGDNNLEGAAIDDLQEMELDIINMITQMVIGLKLEYMTLLLIQLLLLILLCSII